MQGFWSDIRHAFRVMRRAPAFSAIAILSLALAIGANTAVFTLLNAVVFRELAVRDPQSLVSVETLRLDGSRGGFTGLDATSEPDVTIPLTALHRLTTTGQTDRFTNLKVPWVRAVARLKPGVTLEQARAHMAALWPSVRAANTPPDYVGKDRENP